MGIIIPEIYTQMLNEGIEGKVKISNYAVEIGTLGDFASEGDSITFPQFSALSEAELLARGAEISTEELKQTESKKTVKHYAKGVSILDVDALEGKGNFLENAINQQAEIFARARDKECVDDIDTNAILKSATVGASAITEDELINALNMWGDDQDDSSYSAIIINSKLLPSFYKMDGFVNSTKTYTHDGNGTIVNGVVGYYRTIPVVLSNVGTFDSTANECKSYILKKGALGKKDKKQGVEIELDRVAKFKRTDIFADELFVIGLIQKDGACIVRKTIA
ncbi:MAG: hypothetical protein ACLSTJ_01725 [Clostridium neonatale]